MREWMVWFGFSIFKNSKQIFCEGNGNENEVELGGFWDGIFYQYH
jgi:hypothetical protein